MTQPSDPGDNRRAGRHDPVEPAPRWVKVFGGVLIVLLLLFVVMHLAGGGFRGHGS